MLVHLCNFLVGPLYYAQNVLILINILLVLGDLFNHSDIEFSDAQTIEKVTDKSTFQSD